MKNSREEQANGNIMLWFIFVLLKETQEFTFENKQSLLTVQPVGQSEIEGISPRKEGYLIASFYSTR